MRGSPLRGDAYGEPREVHDGAGIGSPGRRFPCDMVDIIEEIEGQRIAELIRIEEGEQVASQDYRRFMAAWTTGKYTEFPSREARGSYQGQAHEAYHLDDGTGS